VTIHTPYRRKRRYLAPAWLAITAVILLLFSGAVSALDSSCNTIIVGQKTAYHFTITDGLPARHLYHKPDKPRVEVLASRTRSFTPKPSTYL
jgi:hypothetical protein